MGANQEQQDSNLFELHQRLLADTSINHTDTEIEQFLIALEKAWLKRLASLRETELARLASIAELFASVPYDLQIPLYLQFKYRLGLFAHLY